MECGSCGSGPSASADLEPRDGGAEPCGPVAKVFAALTKADQLEKWFFSRCTTDPRTDGRHEIFWESRTDNARDHRRHGRFLEVIENKRIRFEWRGLKLDDDAAPTVVTIDPEEIDANSTELCLVHDGWGKTPDWIENRDNHESGWSFYMDNLARYFTGGADLREDYFEQRTYAENASAVEQTSML
jgi:uncharacterized protein YndB with AHSA1/START domain